MYGGRFQSMQRAKYENWRMKAHRTYYITEDALLNSRQHALHGAMMRGTPPLVDLERIGDDELPAVGYRLAHILIFDPCVERSAVIDNHTRLIVLCRGCF